MPTATTEPRRPRQRKASLGRSHHQTSNPRSVNIRATKHLAPHKRFMPRPGSRKRFVGAEPRRIDKRKARKQALEAQHLRQQAHRLRQQQLALQPPQDATQLQAEHAAQAPVVPFRKKTVDNAVDKHRRGAQAWLARHAVTAENIVAKARLARGNIRRRLQFRRKLRSKRSKNSYQAMKSHLQEAEFLLKKASGWQACFDACATNTSPENLAHLFQTVNKEDKDKPQ